MVSQVVTRGVDDRLLDATEELVLEGGPRAATVSAAATRAGLSRMTVYRKFGDRHSLLAALFNRELGGILPSSADGIDTPGQIADLVTGAVRTINEHPLMAAVLRHEPEQLTEWMTSRLGRTQRQAQALLRQAITNGQSTGRVRGGDPDDMAMALVLVAQAFVFGHRIGGTDIELHRLVKGFLT